MTQNLVKSSEDFTIHSIHEDEVRHNCSICKKSFKCKSELMRHHRAHTGIRPFMCNLCYKSFNYNSALLEHLRVHSGEKPYQCSECKKCFRQGSTLNRHKRIHTGEKPHQCEVCGKCFSEKKGRDVHKRTHTCKQPFYCSKCHQYFMRRASLLRHIKKNHLIMESNPGCLDDEAKKIQRHESTAPQAGSTEVVVKVERPDIEETSLEMLIKDSDLLNDLNYLKEEVVNWFEQNFLAFSLVSERHEKLLAIWFDSDRWIMWSDLRVSKNFCGTTAKQHSTMLILSLIAGRIGELKFCHQLIKLWI